MKKQQLHYGSMRPDTKITVVISRYQRLARGWELLEEEIKEVDRDYYQLTVDAKQFFNNLGCIERHKKSYTPYGYIVTSINSISPDKDRKTTREFKFEGRE